jgi:hypothetical protein
VSALEHVLKELFIFATLVVGAGIAIAWTLRARGLSWTWAALGVPLAVILTAGDFVVAFATGSACLLACALGACRHNEDVRHGGDLGQAARTRIGVAAGVSRLWESWRSARLSWVRGGWMQVGRDQRGLPVGIPVGYESGAHALVVGATGSGKTVTQAWIVGRLIDAGYGAIVIDPKGDRLLRAELEATAQRNGRPLLVLDARGAARLQPLRAGNRHRTRRQDPRRRALH